MTTKPNSSQIRYDNGTVKDVLDDLTGPTGSVSVGYTPAGIGAIATDVQSQLREVVRVSNFGSDSAAIVKAVAQISALGGGELVFPHNQNYTVDWSSASNVLLSFSGLSGVIIRGNGSTISFINSNGATKVFIRADSCNGILVENLNLVGSLPSLSNSNGGEIFFNALNGTKNVQIRNVTASNGYRFFGSNHMSGVFDSAAREANRVTNIEIDNIYLHTVYYGFYFGFSGDNVRLNAKTVNAGRSYYVANASNHDVTLNGAHGGAFSDCLISCQADSAASAESNSIENIRLNYSTDGRYAGSGAQSAYEALVAFDCTIVSASAAACYIRNVDVRLNAAAKPTDTTANLVTFRKYYNNGASIVVDTVGGRSHHIKRVTITGQAKDCNYLTDKGVVLFAGHSSMNWSGDVINGIVMRDFNITGTPSSDAIYINGAGGTSTTQTFSLENLTVDGNITTANIAGATLSYHGVKSTNVSAYDNDVGTWTAALGGSVSDPTTPITATGTYVKRGKEITVQVAFNNVNTAGASGNVIIKGLPFTVAANGVFIGAATSSNINIPGLGLVALAYGNTTQIDLMSPQNSLALLNSTYTTTGTGRYVFVTLTYFV